MERKTKIIATLGPATEDAGVIQELIERGMNVARFNFSHGTHDEHAARFKLVREIGVGPFSLTSEGEPVDFTILAPKHVAQAHENCLSWIDDALLRGT